MTLPLRHFLIGILIQGLRTISSKGWKNPTEIQVESIPVAQGRDVVGQARTGSGKTAALEYQLSKRQCFGRTPSTYPLPNKIAVRSQRS